MVVEVKCSCCISPRAVFSVLYLFFQCLPYADVVKIVIGEVMDCTFVSSEYVFHTILMPHCYLRNRKHFLCFYWVIETRVEVWENEKCCGNTSCRQVFPQLFQVLPNLHECFYNLIETRRKCFLFLLENGPRKITKNEENLIVLFII